MKTILCALLLAVVPFSVMSTPPLPTNEVTSINFQFVMIAQGKTNGSTINDSTWTITTSTIIGAIGNSLNTTFSPAAVLLARRPVTYSHVLYYSTNAVGVVSSKTKLVAEVGVDTDYIKDGSRVVNVDKFFNGGSTNYAVAYELGNVGFEYRVAFLSVEVPRLSFSTQGFLTRRLVWQDFPGRGFLPVYSESWVSMVGGAEGAVYHGFLTQPFVGFDWSF